MPDQDIASGATETIITEAEAARVDDPESDVVGFVIDVTGDPIRMIDAEQSQFAREGIPLDAGDIVTGFDPRGYEWVAFGDGSGTSTVSVHYQKGTFAGDVHR